MSYFVSPRERTDWHIDAQWLLKEIQMQWPDAFLRWIDAPQSANSLTWTLQLSGGWHLDGALAKDGSAVHLDGDVRACASFAVWLRSKVTGTQELVFYDEAYSADVALSVGVTAAEVAKPFLLA